MHSNQPEVENYEVLVLGSGEAGKYIAWNMASSGKKTGLIERRYIGGSCPNIACLPSKNVIHSANVAHMANQLAAYGLNPSPPGVDMQVVRSRKRMMVTGLIEMHEDRFTQTGTELILGEGRFVAPRTIEVTLADGHARVLTAGHVVISTGSRASIDPIPGLVEAEPLTHVEALELGAVPDHLLILGGGYVGLEFAQAMRRFGSRVTIVERNLRLLHSEDKEVSEAVTRIFLEEGIEIMTEARLKEVRGRSGEQVALHLERDGEGPMQVTGTHLLVATGRTPNTEGIGLERADVALTSMGFVQVNERLETTAAGVFAVGDCAGSPQFTHIAFDDSRVVREALAGRSRVTTGRLVPSCLFIDPELARIGLNETEAKRRGIPYRLVKLPMKAVLRTRTTGETEGFLEALIGNDDRILGFTALGASAGEMMAPVQLAMSAGLPYTALRDSIFAHPTFAEGLVYLFSATPVRVD